MPTDIANRLRITAGWLTAGLGLSTAVLITSAYIGEPASVPYEARLLPAHMRGATPWKTIRPDQVEAGNSIPPHTNVIFTVPDSVTRISRRVFFGRKGETTRYWGYCFPNSPEEADRLRADGFPGTLFLSERERAIMRTTRRDQRRASFSVHKNLNDEDLNEANSIRGKIRHQKDLFFGGDVCYIQTEAPLPIGTDEDADGANTKVEKDHKSDPTNRDSDGDGIVDGLEVFRRGEKPTNPTIRDTDGDGLIDGLEDKNRNGRLDVGETSPIEWDSDRDGLCDGLCKVDKGRRLAGEDKNLDGKLDDNETSPILRDTDGDGILDEQEFRVCELKGGKDCD